MIIDYGTKPRLVSEQLVIWTMQAHNAHLRYRIQAMSLMEGVIINNISSALSQTE